MVVKISFDQRCSRILEASHIVYVNDYTVHLVDGIETHDEEIYVRCKDGMLYRDLDVFTLDEATEMEKQMINLCKQLSIKYHD